MSILSFEFILFAAAVLLVYYLLPLKGRWLALLAASVFFVLQSGWYGAAHLTAAALMTWGGGRWLSALREKKKSGRIVLTLLLALDLGAMAVVKYQPVIAAGGRMGAISAFAVPLGLSYFTFQTAGYLIDVYRGKAEAQKNPLRVWLFAGYFPQLTQGPISTWKELGQQLQTGRRFEPAAMVSGFQLMLWGYFKKLVIADRLAPTTAALLAKDASLPGWLTLGGVVLYTLRLYTDFSGGMDIVRGVSRMLGIELPENFRRPFFAKSVAEYWRRWHITLGAWFRSYLLYPLTTSRAGLALGRSASKLLGKKAGLTVPSALATLLVFLLIGIWHAANWNALAYGAYFGVIMAVSMMLEPVWKKLNRALRLPKKGWVSALRMARTWLLVLGAQYFAFTSSPSQGLALMRASFENWSLTDFTAQVTAVMPPMEWLIAGLGLLAVLIVDVLCEQKINICDKLARTRIWIRWPLLLLLLLCVFVFGVYGPGYDGAAFVYTQF